jgi:hypothetical protein
MDYDCGAFAPETESMINIRLRLAWSGISARRRRDRIGLVAATILSAILMMAGYTDTLTACISCVLIVASTCIRLHTDPNSAATPLGAANAQLLSRQN